MGAQPFIGEIMIVPYNFPPRGWAFCHGQLLPIAQHTALFSLLGTTYGGDGRTTFALPDLRGRFPLGEGSGSGLPTRPEGKQGGETFDIEYGRKPIIGLGKTNEIVNISPTQNYMPPYLKINYAIALQGVYPSRV